MMKHQVVLAIAIGCGCHSDMQTVDAAPPPLVFLVSVNNIDPSVTSVLIGGESQTIVETGSSRSIEYSKTYQDYSIARASGIVEAEFLAGTSTFYIGHVAVGVCASCVPLGCPTLEEIESENVKYENQLDVTPTDYTCFECSGGLKRYDACQ